MLKFIETRLGEVGYKGMRYKNPHADNILKAEVAKLIIDNNPLLKENDLLQDQIEEEENNGQSCHAVEWGFLIN